MHIAKVSTMVAKRLGLNANHHARVWCSCMDDSVYEPGTFAGQHATVVNERTREQASTDTRRLGAFDYLGVIDLRETGSALALYQEHLKECGDATT